MIRKNPCSRTCTSLPEPVPVVLWSLKSVDTDIQTLDTIGQASKEYSLHWALKARGRMYTYRLYCTKKIFMHHQARLMHIKDSQTFMRMAYAEVSCGGFYAKKKYAETYLNKGRQANSGAYEGQRLA